MIKAKPRLSKLKKLFAIILSIMVILSLFPAKKAAASVNEVKDDTDLAKINTYKFNLNINNATVVSKSDAVEETTLNNPWYEGNLKQLSGPLKNFALRVDKNNKGNQAFYKPLELKFSNVGEVYGKKVDAYLKFNKVTLHYLNNEVAKNALGKEGKTAVPFFQLSNFWGEGGNFEIGNLIYSEKKYDPYKDQNPTNLIKGAFWNDADITAELRYSDGSKTDLKLVMRPADIDVVDGSLRETFYIKNYSTSVDKRVINNRNKLNQVTEGDSTYWKATTTTEGDDQENNVSGLAVRSVDNKLNFGYHTTINCSTVFGLFVEGKIPAPKKTVDKPQVLAKAGEKIVYTGTFKVPTPGKDIIGPLSNLNLIDNFDDRLDFKSLKVDVDGKTLTENKDYTITTYGQTVIVNMGDEYLQRESAGKEIKVTYNMETNKKVEGKTSGIIDNIVTLKADNTLTPSNKVRTTLLYKKTHEFISGTPGKELPQSIKDLTPKTVERIPNGTVVHPDQPTKTKVTVKEGNWVFKGYDKETQTIDGQDVHFIGKWVLEEFTKPVKDVVNESGTTINGKVVKPGETLTYIVKYKNTTDQDRDVTIKDKIPAYTTYVQNSADNNGKFADGQVTWSKKVAKGDTWKVTFKVKVNDDANGVEVINKARVADGVIDIDTNPTNNPTPKKPVKDVVNESGTTINGKVVKPGDILTYTVSYTNTTGEDRDVTIKDKIPAYTTYVENSADNNGKFADGQVTWSKKVAKGQTWKVTFKVKVNDDANGVEVINKARVADGVIDIDTNPTNNPTPKKPVKDVVNNAGTTINGKVVKPGETLTYTVEYKNTTDQDRDVTIKDKIPAYTTYVQNSADNNGKFADGQVTWSKKVAKGDTWKVTFKVKVNDDANGVEVINKARVADGVIDIDTNPTNNPTPKKPVKDVVNESGTTINGKVVKPGDILTYTVSYTNTTGEDRDVTIKDKIPAYTTYVENSADNNGKFADGQVTWSKKVAKGQTWKVTFKVKVNDDANGVEVINKARVADGVIDIDTNPTNNPTPKKPVKDVVNNAGTTINGKVVKPGETLTYTVEYKNTTDQDRDVTIKDKIPAYTTYVENSADNNGKFANGEVTWSKKVAKGQTWKVTFKVKVNDDANGVEVINKARVADGVIDIDTNPTNNPTPKKPVKDVVNNAGTTINGKVVKPGETLTYTVEYKNTTDQDRDVTIKDKIPAYTTYVQNSADNNGKFINGEVIWTKRVAKGETWKVTFKVKVNEETYGKEIKNIARTSDGVLDIDTNPTNNPVPPKTPPVPPTTPKIPPQTPKTPLPKTGDAATNGVYAGLATLLAGLGLALRRKRKDEE
ncbi:Sgo0707 family adhesin [Gemella bergeri]